MNADPADALFFGFADHGFQMVDVRMHIAVRKQSDEMKGGFVINNVGNHFFPGCGLIQTPVFNALVDQFCALGINLAASQRIVTHFTVAHIIIGWQTDCGSMGFDLGVGIIRE